ncbi:MAG: putative flagellar assembly protein H [Inoviridae sp.]|nr:MAG: putative flagellar assembly protein H [Inoviridae sp.]
MQNFDEKSYNRRELRYNIAMFVLCISFAVFLLGFFFLTSYFDKKQSYLNAKTNTQSILCSSRDVVADDSQYTYTSPITYGSALYGIAPNYNSGSISLAFVIQFRYQNNVCYVSTSNTIFYAISSSTSYRPSSVFSVTGADSYTNNEFTAGTEKDVIVLYSFIGLNGYLRVVYHFSPLPYIGSTYQLNTITTTVDLGSTTYSYQTFDSGSLSPTFLSVSYSITPISSLSHPSTTIRYTDLALELMRTGEYSDGYNNGYYLGYQEGQQSGFDSGYSQGNSAGLNTGYHQGYNKGVLESNNYSFLGLIGAVFDAPIQAFNGLFDFEILGVNMKQFALTLLTFCFIITVVRLVKGG